MTNPEPPAWASGSQYLLVLQSSHRNIIGRSFGNPSISHGFTFKNHLEMDCAAIFPWFFPWFSHWVSGEWKHRSHWEWHPGSGLHLPPTSMPRCHPEAASAMGYQSELLHLGMSYVYRNWIIYNIMLCIYIYIHTYLYYTYTYIYIYICTYIWTGGRQHCLLLAMDMAKVGGPLYYMVLLNSTHSVTLGFRVPFCAKTDWWPTAVFPWVAHCLSLTHIPTLRSKTDLFRVSSFFEIQNLPNTLMLWGNSFHR